MQTNILLGIEDFVKRNYAQIGRRGCARELKVTEEEVESVKRKFGLKLSKEGLKRVRLEYAAKQNHECNVNPETFINILIPEAAYILGLIWADGNICDKQTTPGISIRQVTTDMGEIKKILDKTGKWNYCENKTQENCQHSSRAYTTNRTLYNYLFGHNYGSKSKESADSIVNTIPDKFKHLFFLGLFDGDGCLFVREANPQGYLFSIASSFEQDWSFMIRLCENLKIDYRIHRKIQKNKRKDGLSNCASSSFIVSRHSDIKELMKWIYQSRDLDGIGFSRKWQKWQTFLSLKIASSTRYTGIRKRLRENFWSAEIPNKYGLGKTIDLGRFPSEEEAYKAQQSKISEMGLVQKREIISGPKEFRPTQSLKLEPCS